MNAGAREGGVVVAVGVGRVEHQQVLRLLPLINGTLGVDIILKILVLIQMIRRQVRDDRDVRTADHAVKLEGAELEHDQVLRAHIGKPAQQRLADVAAEEHAKALGLHELGNDRRSRRFAVAARHGKDAAGAEREKQLHLRGDEAAALAGRLQVLVKGQQSRRTENDILVKPLEIVLAELQLRAEGAQRRSLLAHLFFAALVAGGHAAAGAQQQLQPGAIAHADADDGDAFVTDGRNIFG